MKYFVAVLFAVFSLSSFGETLTVRDYAQAKPITKSKLVLTRTQKIVVRATTNPDDLEDNDDGGADEIDVYVAYRRPEVVDQPADEVDISEHARMRLFIARTLALKKYLEVYA